MSAALLLLALLAAADPGPAVRVTATPAKTEVTVGEPFAVEVVASGPAGTSYTFPAEAGDEKVELRALPAPASPAPPPDRLRYEGAVFALGDPELPAVRVKYRLPDGSEGEAQSAPVRLKVGTLLPKEPKEQTPADIRGPLPLGVGRAFWAAAGLLALALAGLAVWLLRRRRGPGVAVPARPATPPDVEALAGLEALLGSGALERGEYRAFYIALTALAKRYLERRLGAPVLEMTSAEMASFLRDHAQAAPFQPALRELAGAADQVKFARAEAQLAEAERHVAALREVVAGLEARLRPAATSTTETQRTQR